MVQPTNRRLATEAKLAADLNAGLAGKQDAATLAAATAAHLADGSALDVALEASYDAIDNAVAVAPPGAPLWLPPTQPALASISSKTAAQIVTDYWEPLRTADPEYVTRAQIGLDQSGVHPLWRYDFTPASYDRTVVVLANMHGGEKLGGYSVSRLMHYVVNEWQSSSWLAWLRRNVRVIVVPVVNPWGATDPSGPRTNSRGVDINRNWDYKHAEYVVPSPPYEKGTAPFSEAETAAVRDLLLSLDDVTAVVDCHDTGESVRATPIAYYAVPPDYPLSPRAQFVREVVDTLRQPGDSVSMHPDAFPYSVNWVASQGWRGAVLEHDQRGTALDSTNMTHGLTWYGNCILRAAAQPPPKKIARSEPRVVEMSFSTGATTLSLAANASVFSELATLHAEFTVPGPGVVIFEGEIVVGGAVTNAWIRPAIAQASGPEPTLTAYSRNERYASLESAAERQPIPFRIALDVHEDASDGWLVKVGLFARSDIATVNVYRYTATAKFFPAERADRYVRMTATGRTGAGAMQQTYPA